MLGLDQAWFDTVHTDNLGRFCVQAPPNATLVTVARASDPFVGPALEPIGIHTSNSGNNRGGCSVGVGACGNLGTVVVAAAPLSCMSGSLHDSLPDGGLPPVSKELYFTQDVAEVDDYRRRLCTAANQRLSGTRSDADGGFCLPVPAGSAFHLGADEPPNCRPNGDPLYDAGAAVVNACSGGACGDLGALLWFCGS